MKLLAEYIDDLHEMGGVSREEYRDNKLIRRAVERTLQTAIEACLDIGHHLITTRRFRTPTDNADVFVVLSEEGVVSVELGQQLIRMARFRNLLVHEYVRLDNEVVYTVLTRQMADIEAFASAIAAYLTPDQT